MLLCNENAIESGGGYTISNSLRFQSASSTYLARTPASNGNRQIFTFSFWVKRGTLGANNLYFTNAGGGTFAQMDFLSGDTLYFASVTASVANAELTTTQVFRDPSAWYHIVYSVDTTQATAANRIKLYVNGAQVTAFATATYPAQNYSFQLNTTTAQNIGRPSTGTLDGYMTEYNFIDGQALTPSSFGATTALTGQWSATKYTGTYGTNGFYLAFANGTSTTTLGTDSSGNGNTWTLNNFTRSAGVSDCWMYDVPSGNGGASATQPSSNYAVVNPINTLSTTITNANLNVSQSVAVNAVGYGTIGMSAGKFYWETTVTSSGGSVMIGIGGDNLKPFNTSPALYYYSNGNKYINGVGTAYGATFTTSDVIGIALDLDASTITFYKNNVSQGTITGVAAGTWYSAWSNGGGPTPSWTGAINFGNRSFTYTPPSGFKSLCTANLAATTIAIGNKYMDATLYTGNGSTLTVTNAGGFQPDFVWIKGRSVVSNHAALDSVRPSGFALYPNLTDAEGNNSSLFTGITSSGFGVAGTNITYNQSAATYVGWQWKAGGTAVTNTSGSISSQVSAGATQGFSVVTWTNNSTANQSVGHGLGVTPSMIITKDRDNGTFNWAVWVTGFTKDEYILLNTTGAKASYVTLWYSVPDSSKFYIGSTGTGLNNGTDKMVAYCFAQIAGFSAFGSYTGNGSADGPFVYTGFFPRYVMIKRTDTTGNWYIHDTARPNQNAQGYFLLANSSAAESGQSNDWDMLSNGFKLRDSFAGFNASGGTYIYMAFATSPFASSNAF